jgi:hypothetical protein
LAACCVTAEALLGVVMARAAAPSVEMPCAAATREAHGASAVRVQVQQPLRRAARE